MYHLLNFTMAVNYSDDSSKRRYPLYYSQTVFPALDTLKKALYHLLVAGLLLISLIIGEANKTAGCLSNTVIFGLILFCRYYRHLL
jgi:hypothetical protein